MRHRAEERPRLPEYNLSIKPTELVGVLKGMGEIVKWPQKMKSTSGIRDTKKWMSSTEITATEWMNAMLYD